MSLMLSEEQELLQDSVSSFVTDNCSVAGLRKLRDSDASPGFDADVWRQAVELGWAAIPFAEEYGGLGLGYAELGIVFEGLGSELHVCPLLSSVVLGGSAVDLAGSEEQKKQILPGVCDGSTLLACAYQESVRHDPYAIATQATADGEGFRLSGRKVLVLDGATADQLVIVARTSGGTHERDGITMFLLDPQADGITIKRNLLIDSRSAANIELDNVYVDGAAVLGSLDEAADVLDEVLLRTAAALSADMLGGIQRSFDITIDYLKIREQFGAKIGSFQGLKHRAARWFCEVELTRSIVLQTLRAIDSQDELRQRLASACKARASDTFHLSGKEGVQMHGGIGVTDDADIGFYMKRARVSEMLSGDANFHRNRFAELRGF